MKLKVTDRYLDSIARKFSDDAKAQEQFKKGWRECEDYNDLHLYGDDDGRLKRCIRCNEYRSILNYYIAPQRKDGLDVYCKYCRKELRIQYEENKEKRKNGKRNLYRH